MTSTRDDLAIPGTERKTGPFRGSLPRWLLIVAGILLGLGIGFIAIAYPILKNTAWKDKLNDGGSGPGGSGGGDGTKVNPQWLDKDTPDSVKTKVLDGTEYKLVFSDEFNQNGRNFAKGQDKIWEAVDLHYWQTGDYEYYTPEQATTKDGNLRITIEKKKHLNQDYVSAMLQTWNNFCFRGGYLEAKVSLPGSPSVSALWPGIWTMGNLGRAGYGSSTDGLWPYSYNTCDLGVRPNQTGASFPSWLPGQRLNKCLCKDQDTPSPGMGRSAPEIDLIEGAGNPNVGGTVSQSHQFGPFDAKFEIQDQYLTIFNATSSLRNSYKGGNLQQAVSVVTSVGPQYFEGKDFQSYAFHYWPGAHGNVTWYVGDQKKWSLDARAVGPNVATGIGQREISEEPMYLVINVAMSEGFGQVDLKNAVFPATMYVDYIRIYQHPDNIDITCDPKDRPTKQYIKDHPKAYEDTSLQYWRDTGYPLPQYQIPAQCPA